MVRARCAGPIPRHPHARQGVPPSGAYATDRSFGYSASNLRRWVEEKTGGAVRADDALSLGLENIRRGGPERVREIWPTPRRAGPCLASQPCAIDHSICGDPQRTTRAYSVSGRSLPPRLD